MGKKRKSCKIGPVINGKISELYTGLRKLIADPLVANYIYSVYTQLGVAEKMTAAGFKVNKQGQHSSKDVFDFLDVAPMINNMSGNSIRKAKERLGAIDRTTGEVIKYRDPIEVLNKINSFNESSKSLVATMSQNGNDYVILVRAKNADTQIKAAEMRNALESWKILEQSLNRYFESAGINMDMESFAAHDSVRKLLNPTNLSRSIDLLRGLRETSNAYLSQDMIEFLLLLNQGTDQVNRITSKWGDTKEAAAKMKESFSNPDDFSSVEKLLINEFLSKAKELRSIDLVAIQEQLAAVKNENIVESDEGKVQQGIDNLRKTYNIDAQTFYLDNDKISKVSEALEHALHTLERQLSDLYKYDPENETREAELDEKIKVVTEAITSKSYFNSIAIFLGETNEQLRLLAERIPTDDNMPAFDTVMEDVRYKAQFFNDLRNIEAGYKFIVEALSKIDTLDDTEEISDTDKEGIKELANTIMKEFDNLNNAITKTKLKEATAETAFIEILGQEGVNGVAVADIMHKMQDSEVYNVLYSMGRSSQPLINAVGGLIRNAQDNRTAKMNEIKLRVRRAHNKLRKAGVKNTRFMYVHDGHIYRIISDIDWDKYVKAKNAAIASFRSQGLRGADLEHAIKMFEKNNTEERAVDIAPDGEVRRTERVPNHKYRLKDNPIDNLTPAQRDYYYEMMQIKAEMETLMPSYTRGLYHPAQVRRDFLDAIGAMFRDPGNPISNLIRAFKNKFKDIFIWREDDTDLGGISSIDCDEDWFLTRGALDNTVRRDIPIHYRGLLKDQQELMLDFSSSVLYTANTAINYACISEVKETVEFLSTYIKDITPREYKGNKLTAELVERSGIRSFKFLSKKSKATMNAALLDGWIDMHLYGVKLKDSNKMSKAIKSLIQYESIRALSVNVKGMVVNKTIGEVQALIECGAGEFFGLGDYLWAKQKMFGNGFSAVGRTVDFLNHNKNNYDVLLAEMFEPVPGSHEEQVERFHSSALRTTLGSFNPLAGYSIGERLLHYTTMYAILHRTKVLVDGSKTSLYNAFKKVKEDGNSELVLKDNVTDLDGNPITLEYLEGIKKRIRLANQSMHGSMSQEDKGIITQYLLGRAVMQFRQWMVEAYSKRFRSKFRDAATGLEREGHYVTSFKYLKNLFTGNNHGKQTDLEKYNNRRTIAETVILLALFALSKALAAGDDEDEYDEFGNKKTKKQKMLDRGFWYNLFVYTTNKTLADVVSESPAGIPSSTTQVLKTIVPVTNTLDGFLYPFYGIPELWERFESGEHKDEIKYWVNIKRKTIPFVKQIQDIDNMYETEEEKAERLAKKERDRIQRKYNTRVKNYLDKKEGRVKPKKTPEEKRREKIENDSIDAEIRKIYPDYKR